MAFLFRRGSNSAAGEAGGADAGGSARPARVLVIAADKQAPRWAPLFADVQTDDGRPVQVVQCSWDQILCSAEPKSRSPCIVHLSKSVKDVDGICPYRTFQPDVCLVRNEVETPTATFKNQLLALMFGGVDGVNSFHSIVACCEKAVMQAELHRLNRELGDDVFPVLEQQFFAGYQEMMYSMSFPAVVKIGSAHAGMGKMRVRDHHDMADFRSVLAMTEGKYCTAEPFIEGEYDLRIQKIGPHYRAFKRVSMSGDWKTNTGSSDLEPIEPVPAKYRRWADEASRLCGGLDILSVDAIHDVHTGKEWIMEVNGTSSGLAPNYQDEDNLHIRDLVLAKLNARFRPRPAPAAAAAAEAEQPTAQPAAADEQAA